MEANLSVWKYYEKDFVHPDMAPYSRKIITTPEGVEVSINKTKRQGCPTLVNPNLVRINKGLKFQKMFYDDPCPLGFEKAEDGYCIRKYSEANTVFYTDKAFIPKKQYWEGYSTKVKESPTQLDMRSVHPETGEFTTYYNSKKSKVRSPKAKPGVNIQKQYDPNWNLPPTRKYAHNPTSESYY